MPQRQGKERECKKDYFHYLQSGTGNSDYLKRSNEWEKERECNRDYIHYHRSGAGNIDYLKRSNELKRT